MNIIKQLTYKLSLPLAHAFVKINFSANKVTLLAFLSSILAGLSLIIDDGVKYFIIFWSMNILLDFCDGTVARINKKSKKSLFRVDHMSDLFKFGIIWIATGYRYLDHLVWLIIAVCIFIYFYFVILSHDYQNYLLTQKNNIINNSMDDNSIKNKINNNWLLRNIYEVLFTIDGHSLFYFLILPVSKFHAFIILFYFSLISFLRAVIIAKKMVNIKL
jgi:hypothetical protein